MWIERLQTPCIMGPVDAKNSKTEHRYNEAWIGQSCAYFNKGQRCTAYSTTDEDSKLQIAEQ